MGPLLDDMPDAVDADGSLASPQRRRHRAAACRSLDEWAAERDRALARAARPTAVAATALTDEGSPDPGQRASTPGCRSGPRPRPAAVAQGPLRHRRRAAPCTACCRPIDLATGAGLDAAVAAQCEAEAIPDRAERRVDAGSAHALDSPSVREAAAPPALARGLRVHAGRRPAARGLRRPALPHARRAGRRRLQDRRHQRPGRARPPRRGLPPAGRQLRADVGAATGEPVGRVTFLFLTPTVRSSGTSPISTRRSIAYGISTSRRENLVGESDLAG